MSATFDVSPPNPRSGSPLRLGKAVQWFKWLMWLGIAGNAVCAVISIGWTDAVLNLLQLEMAQPLVWPRFAAFLLILLSIFYIPSAIDPLAHRYSAIVAILCRFGGVVFFTIIGGRYIMFGLFDLTFGLPQAVLLLLAWRSFLRDAGPVRNE
jgi:hypothetical protein